MDSVSEKTCTGCGKVQPLDQFCRDRTRPDGLRTNCRSCLAAYRRANAEKIAASKRETRQRHHETEMAYKKAYREEHRDERNAKRREYGKANPEIIDRLRRAHREANPEYYRQYIVAWKSRNPERWRHAQQAARHRRRARLAGLPAERVTLAVLIVRDRARCQICGKAKGQDLWSIDHILPVSKGGGNTYSNTRLAHYACNSRRGNRGHAQMRLIG